MTGDQVVCACCSVVDLCQQLTCVFLSYSKDKTPSLVTRLQLLSIE